MEKYIENYKKTLQIQLENEIERYKLQEKDLIASKDKILGLEHLIKLVSKGDEK